MANKRVFKIVGVEYGIYNESKWGKLHLLQPTFGENSLGWRPVNKDDSKATYDLCIAISNDWEIYEDQKVYCGCELGGRIDRVELAE